MLRACAVLLTILVTTSVAAQTQQTTTSVERGERDASIRAQSTGQQQEPARRPATDQIGPPASPRQPGTTPTSPPATRRQRPAEPRSSGQTARQRAAAAGDPDVYLEVPNLRVDQILLEVDRLEVHLALDARVANLVSLKAGVDASIGRVKLEIRGVEAEAYLTVRLHNVARIIDRTLTTLDRNPELVERLLTTVDRTVGTVGGVANTALQPGGVVSQTVGTVGRTLDNVTAPGGVLSETVNTLGQTVQRTLDVSGNMVERTLDTTGRVLNENNVGRIADLTLLNETTNAAGQLVRQVRDSAGMVIEYVTDKSGRIVSSRVISRATGGQRR